MDTLIKNASVLTINNSTAAYVGITDGVITYLGDQELPANKIIDANGKIIMPGLINTHTHMPMSLLRGYADDLNLQSWLFDNIFPAEDKMTGDDAYWGTMLSLCEMISGGTTCFCDMYFFTEEIIKATLESGIRADIGRALTDIAGEQSGNERLEQTVELYHKYHGEKIHINLAPHAVYTCSSAYLKKAAETAQKFNLRVHTHISETEAENIDCIKAHGKTPTQYMHDSGLFSQPALAAHCVFLSDEDIEIFKKHDVSVAHNPCSNLKLASGIAPIAKYINNGLNISLGTDGAASNNNLNMFKEIQLAATLHKGAVKEPTLITAKNALEMATVNGAKSLGRESEIGQIKEGMKADIIFVDVDNPHMTPIYTPSSSIVYSAMASDVIDVMIDGEFVYENKEFKTLDIEKIIFEVRRIQNATYNS